MINRKLLILSLVGGFLFGPTLPEYTNILTHNTFKIRNIPVHKDLTNVMLCYDCFLFSGTARANENQTFSDSVKIFSGLVEDIDGIKPQSGVVTVKDVISDTTYSSDLDTLARFYIEIVKHTSGVKNANVSTPSGYNLSPFYPNPNDGRASPSFNWTLAADSDVNVSVYNILGQKVKEIAAGRLRAGNYKGFWDGTNEAGVKVAEGVYFVNVRGESSKGKRLNLTEKCLLLDQISGSGTGYAFGNGGFTYDPESGLFKADTGSDYELSAEIPGRFPVSLGFSSGDNTEGLSLVSDRKASFTSGFSDTLFVVEGGTVYKIAIPSVDNDDSDHSFSVRGDYASIVGDSILISPPKDANGTGVLELIAKENGFSVDSLKADVEFYMGNYAPTITSDFPTDTLYVIQGVSDLDSIAAIPVRDGIHDRYVQLDFATDANNDPLVWTAQSSDTSKINAFVQDGVLYVAGKDTTGYGIVNVRVSDPSGKFDERNLAVLVFGKDRTYEEGGKTNYYVPWSSVLDVNRINSVEQFLIDEGYREESLDRNIIYGRWKEMKKLRDVEFIRTWTNEFNFEGWSWESQKMLIDYTLDELKYDNVNLIRLRQSIHMKDKNSNDLFVFYEPSEFTNGPLDVAKRDFELKYIVNQAHNKGMGVMIGPFISDVTFGRHEIKPTNWNIWYENYGNILKHLAQLGYDTGLDILRVGENFGNHTSSISDEQWGNLFREQIHKSRLIYPGPEVYLDHMYFPGGDINLPIDWNKIKIWNDVDINGCGAIDYYSGLVNLFNIFTNPNPTYEELLDLLSWHNENVKEGLRDVTNRPFLMFENGAPSQDSLFMRWPEYISGTLQTEPNMEMQKIYYEALFDVMKDKDWFFGHGWYGSSFFPATGGVNDAGLSPRGKPAEDVMRYYYGNGDIKSRIIRIDGNFDDWKPELLLATDPLGDSKTTAYDLKAIYGVRDDMYLYLMVEFEGGLRDIDAITVPLDFNNDNNPDAPLGCFYAGKYWGTDTDKWLAGVSKDMSWQGSRGLLMVGADSTRSRFEFRIPYRVLDNNQIIQLIGLQAINNSIPELMDEIDGIIRIN